MAINKEGWFGYVSAAEVTRTGRVPRGMIPVRLAAQRYVVFRHEGHVASWAPPMPISGNVWFPAA